MKTKNTIKLSLLTAMHFNRSMTRKELYYIVKDTAKNTPDLLSALQREGKITKDKNDKDKFTLTKKGLNQVIDTGIELIKKEKKGEKQHIHNLALSKAIFLIMLTIENEEIISIEKEKGDIEQLPDITITLRNKLIYIEIDTGSQRTKIIESKIKTYKLNNKTPLFLTKSQTNYNTINASPEAKALLLDSPNIQTELYEMFNNLQAPQPQQSTAKKDIIPETNLTSLKPQPDNEKIAKHQSIMQQFFKKD